jgi:hypothetical protein
VTLFPSTSGVIIGKREVQEAGSTCFLDASFARVPALVVDHVEETLIVFQLEIFLALITNSIIAFRTLRMAIKFCLNAFFID